ncbi:uncharacterized protein LOC143057297 isoform X1 [Mytilus galloprovincialis]|uniref:uncharacterized protein LOC143057297 isoform X1 n=1 Tax=Mytilus galloprovincialis TaxID=29158 RepID=UPI003F7BA98A
MPKLKRNCWTLPYHRKRRAIKQLQHVKSMRKKVLASTKPEEFTVEVADSGVVIGTGTIHDSYWSVTIPEGGNHFNGDSNSCTSQDIFENEHTDLDLEIVVDENSAEKPCIQIIGEVQNCFEKIDIEHLDENLAKEHGIIIDGEEENSFETIKDVGIGNEMVSSESNELSRVISPLASYNDNNYNAVQTDCLSKTVQYVEIGSEMVSSLIDNSYNTDQTGGLRITENIENSSETVQYIEIGSERELSKNNELYRVVSPITSLINNSHNTVQTDGVRITRNKQNSFETGQYAEHVEIGSVMASSENNELNNVDSPFPSYNSYSAVLYKNNSYTTVQTDISQQDCNELGGVIAPVTLYNSSSYRTVQTDISQQDYHDGSESNELGGVIAPVTLYNNSSYRTVQTDISQQDCNDVSESNELGGVIAPVTLYNNSSYNTVQTEASQQDYHDGSDTDSTVSNDFVTVKVELPDGTTELLETIPYENYPTVQSEHADIDLYGSHTDNVNIHNNKIMSESELFRITHNVNAIPDQSMPGTSTQSFIRDNDQVEGGQDNYQEWDIGMLPFVMETMKEQENTQSLLDKNMQKAKKKKVQEAKLKAGICSSNRCCPGCDTFGNHVRKPPKTKKTKTTKIDSALDEEKSRSPKAYRRKFPMERCDFCPMVFRGAWPKYKKQNHIIAEHCSKDVLEELRKRKKKNEVLSEPKSKFVQYSKKPKYEMIRLDLEFPDYLYGMECIECNKVIREEHFRKFLKCTKCNYSSMCSRAYIEHMINMHGTRNRSSNKYVPCSSRFMECACGFVHIEGNKMAEHLLLCEYNQLSCKIVNSKQISSRREDDPETSSWKKKSVGIVDGVTLHQISKGKICGSFPSKPLKKFRRHKCSICYAALKIRMDEQQRLQKAVLEVNDHHNYSKPACSSPGTNPKGAPGCSPPSINANEAPVCSSLHTDANGGPSCSAPRTYTNGEQSSSSPRTNTNGGLSCSAPRTNPNGGLACSAPRTNATGAPSCSLPLTNANRAPSCSSPRTNANRGLSCSAPRTNPKGGPSCSLPHNKANGGPSCSLPRNNANRAPACSSTRTNANKTSSGCLPCTYGNRAPACSFPLIYGNGAAECSYPCTYGNGAPAYSDPRTYANEAPLNGAPSLVSKLDNVPSTSDDQHICDASHDFQVENDQALHYPRPNSFKTFSQDWVTNKLFKQLQLKDTELNEQNKNKEKEKKCTSKRNRGKGKAKKAEPKRTYNNGKAKKAEPKRIYNNGKWERKPSAKSIHNIKNREERQVLAKLFHELICCVNRNSSVNKQNKRIAKIRILKKSTDCIKFLRTESSKLKLERKWLEKENLLLVENLQTLQKKINVS